MPSSGRHRQIAPVSIVIASRQLTPALSSTEESTPEQGEANMSGLNAEKS